MSRHLTRLRCRLVIALAADRRKNAAINFDFILYYNLLLCFIQLEMHVRLICAIKFYLLTYLLNRTDMKSATCLFPCTI